MKYYITKKPVLNFPVQGKVGVFVSFGATRKYSTDDADIIAYMNKLLAKPHCAFKEVSAEVYNGYNTSAVRQDKRAQILAAMATSKGGAALDIPPISTNVPAIKAVSTADSPTTGGQNPAGANVTQAETIAALKAKVKAKVEAKAAAPTTKSK